MTESAVVRHDTTAPGDASPDNAGAATRTWWKDADRDTKQPERSPVK